jgi:competence protein ComEA
MQNGKARWLALVFTLWAIVPAGAEYWQPASGKYEKLRGCQLIASGANDGDSFMVRHGRDSFLFRLYAVDTAETTMNYPDRVTAQARHFGITPEEAIKIGLVAEKFTQRLLAGPFTVDTCWQDAKGASHVPRYYAVITLSDGRDLAEQLAAAGLARVYGFTPTTPGFSLPKLEGLERLAKTRKLGAYGLAKNAGATASANPTPTRLPPSIFASPTPAPEAAGNKVNLNTASEAELVALPGIGPHYAHEIIAGRPYAKLEDLGRINGIGPKTIVKLEPYVFAGPK